MAAVQWEFLDLWWWQWRLFESDWESWAEGAFQEEHLESIESLPDPNDESVKWRIVFTRVGVNKTDSISHHIQQRLKKVDGNWVHVMESDRFVRRLYFHSALALFTPDTSPFSCN